MRRLIELNSCSGIRGSPYMQVDLLVNNAGFMTHGAFESINPPRSTVRRPRGPTFEQRRAGKIGGGRSAVQSN